MNYANFLREQLMKRFVPHYLLLLMLLISSAACAENEMQIIGSFAIDRTEVTIGQFQRYVDTTKTVTAAERAGGGSTFESGWEQRKGWNWRANACLLMRNGAKRPTLSAGIIHPRDLLKVMFTHIQPA
jgi:Sulfatase-modifying factor enzyme 1